MAALRENQTVETEILAVSTVQRAIAECAHLTPVIDSNDKTILTDGHIDVFEEAKPKSKGTLQGRVSVQVKGRARYAKLRESLRFAVPVVDLNFYRQNAGVLYFIVAFNPKKKQQQTYFAMLSPFTIEWLLEPIAIDTNTVSVEFKSLPSDPHQIEKIVRLALKKRDENVALGFDPTLLQQARSLTIHTATNLNFDVPLALTPGQSDFSLILTTQAGMRVPLSGEIRIFPRPGEEQHSDLSFTSGSVSYDTAKLRWVEDRTLEARLSDGLTLRFLFEKDSFSMKANLTIETDLDSHRKAALFYLSIVESGTLLINDHMVGPVPGLHHERTQELRDHIATLENLDVLAQALQVETRLIDLTQISPDQMRQLNDVYRSLVKGEHFTDSSGRVSRVHQDFAQWKIELVMLPADEDDSWRLVDPFHPDTRQQFRWHAHDQGDDDSLLITAYDMIDEEELPNVVNTRLALVAEAYDLITLEPRVLQLANERVLAFIRAADVSAPRRAEFLDASERLNEWIMARDPDGRHHSINQWQVQARRGDLSRENLTAVRQLKHEVARGVDRDSVLNEIACAILLREWAEVDYLLTTVDEDAQNRLRSWPIWTLRRAAKAPTP